MELHEECRGRLVECLAKGLQEVKFRHQFFLDYTSLRSIDSCTSVLPRKIQELARLWISSEYPLRDFSYSFVAESRDLYSAKLAELSPEEFPVRLSDLLDIEQIARQIIDSFETLPWEYTIVLPFVRIADSEIRWKQLPLSESLVLKKSSELKLSHPRKTIRSPWADLLDPATDWSAETLYLEATRKGYIGVGRDTETLEQFYQELRAAAGIGLAVEAFELAEPYSLYSAMFPQEQPFFSKPLYVWKKEEGTEAKVSTRYIPDKVGPLEQLSVRRKDIDRIALLPIAFGDSNECDSLREAGQWYFASTVEKNEIFKFVEAVVVLEILFNDEATAREVGVERLIANRCAYLVASSTAERQEIVKSFKEIYEARSNIVHKGKARLSKEERNSLIRARALGACAISRELGMIARSQQHKSLV